jgi:beta-lactamase regulating signal transducer with metallopeptidase domain
MTALWISLAAVVALVLVWRLRRASRKVEQILREERELTERESEPEGSPEEHSEQAADRG